MQREIVSKRPSVWHWITGSVVLTLGYFGSLFVIAFLFH